MRRTHYLTGVSIPLGIAAGALGITWWAMLLLAVAWGALCAWIEREAEPT